MVGRACKALMRRDVRFFHYDFPHSGIQAVMKKGGRVMTISLL
jgi:hypothetical protein